jgi:beta-glucanase (GH16 family)
MFSLIDAATPQEAMTYTSTEDGTEWQLVFSDEFETPGRTFYPGGMHNPEPYLRTCADSSIVDDPFWEAVNLHYWQTNNLEWYSPDSLTTVGGHLQITLSAQPNHGLNYMGGMMSSWNKFCFTGTPFF